MTDWHSMSKEKQIQLVTGHLMNGLSRRQIAEQVGVLAGEMERFFNRNKLSSKRLTGKSVRPRVSPQQVESKIWALDDDEDRRQMIYERARRGAAKQLKRNEVRA